MIGIEPWSPEIDKIEHPAHGIPNIGAVISACGLHGLLAGKAEGTIYFMAALHWLYIGSTWSTSSTDSSQDSFGSQTTNNS